ncbi:MAG: hypothetical protein SOV71_08050 [Anaerovoracaceae bacterium]|nr:hypothetical protein [Bacillota bacterium]MDY2671482.1 hypothetical protein [Anaerovoracaceae bacterium]
MLQDILTELDIEDAEDFRYFEQFAALMETPLDIDYDTFAELMTMPDKEALTDMVSSFFEDVVKGIPDDNTALYRSVETYKDVLTTLSEHIDDRGPGFFTDEMFSFREWFLEPESVICTPEDGESGVKRVSPCEAFILYREEKLSGTKYDYDFSEAMPEEPDDYTLSMVEEYRDDYREYGYDYDEDGLDELPDELPEDFDVANYVPGETDLSEYKSFDPYRDGFIDRDDPVIDGEFYD